MMGITFYFIDNEYYFSGFDLMTEIEVEYRKFGFFLKSGFEHPAGDRFPSELIHCHRLADRTDSGLSG